MFAVFHVHYHDYKKLFEKRALQNELNSISA